MIYFWLLLSMGAWAYVFWLFWTYRERSVFVFLVGTCGGYFIFMVSFVKFIDEVNRLKLFG